MTKNANKWERRQQAYQRLPRIVRYPLLGLAFLMLPTGIIAMFTPLAVLEVGSLFIFASLTILSFEFGWAYRLLAMIQRKLQDKKFRKKMTIFMAVILIAYAIFAIVKFVHI